MELKNNQNTKELTPSKQPAGNVVLPFDESQFKDFIVSLLGKPQTITKRFDGSFEICKDDLVNLFQILNQRVHQQNDSKLIQFRATVSYDDYSTVTLNGFDHLVNYNETLPIVSKGIHLTWQYLIKFQDKDAYERQEINLSFVAENMGSIAFDEEVSYYAHDNTVNLRIQHTARTWGADIEALLSKHISSMVTKNGRLTNMIRYNSENLLNVLKALLYGVTLSFSLYKTSELKVGTPKIDTLNWLHHYGSLFFMFIGTYILLKITTFILEEHELIGKPSFILLTSASIKSKVKKLKSYRYEWTTYLVTAFGSLILGIVGNYIYSYLIAH